MKWLAQSGPEPCRVGHEILDFDASFNLLSLYDGVFWGGIVRFLLPQEREFYIFSHLL